MKKKSKKKTPVSLTGIRDLLTIGLGLATLFSFMARLFWAFDLFTHFRVQYFQIGLVLIGITLWRRENRRALFVAVIALLNYAFVLPLYFGKPEPTQVQTVRAMQINLNAGNGNSEQVLETVRATDPDILLLMEVTTKWVNELGSLGADYPHKVSAVRDDCFGMLLLSKVSLKNASVIEIGPAGIPSITVDAYLPSGTISIIGTHPLPPIGAERSTLRNVQLQELPPVVKQQPYPVLLMGDLNITSWSPHFKDLINDSGLRNSMQGFGFQPSWRGNAFLKIPIDHVLHSDEITMHQRAIGPDVGSDHYPVIVDFTVD